MPPPRYNQQNMGAPYGHFSSQQHQQSQHSALPPPSQLGPLASFNPSTSSTPFTNFSRDAATSDNTSLLSSMYTRHNLNPQALAALQQQQAVQQQQSQAQAYDIQMMAPQPQDPRIRDVWIGNLKQEMAHLRALVDEHGYTYIAMDTEFPGIVARPVGAFSTKADYHYQTLRCNVDLLKMIQLGITLFKPDGSLPTDPKNIQTLPNGLRGVCTWQFNFNFSLQNDMYAASSTAMLSVAGLDFKRHEAQGIDPFAFAALLISSGLALAPEVKWISFHSGYDFGYLMKVMLNRELPDTEREFHMLLSKFFPSLFDIKFIVKQVANAQASRTGGIELSAEASRIIQVITQKSGLQDLANELGIARIGIQHQAGSDSLLTGQVYFKMKEKIFAENLDEAKYKGQVWGLNGQVAVSAPQNIQAGGPSTPQANVSGLVSQQTPGHVFSTPGGFGNFQYNAGSGAVKG